MIIKNLLDSLVKEVGLFVMLSIYFFHSMVLLSECQIRVDPRLLFLPHYWFFFNVAIVDEFKYLVMVLTEISIHCYANILGVISFLQKIYNANYFNSAIALL